MTDNLVPGETYTANQMNDFIGGKHQGGIRYSGNFPDLNRIGVIIGGGADAIYPDEMHRGTITDIERRLDVDQSPSVGNRAVLADPQDTRCPPSPRLSQAVVVGVVDRLAFSLGRER